MIHSKELELTAYATFVGGVGYWQLHRGVAIGKWGAQFTREENPKSFWFQIIFCAALSFGCYVYAVLSYFYKK